MHVGRLVSSASHRRGGGSEKRSRKESGLKTCFSIRANGSSPSAALHEDRDASELENVADATRMADDSTSPWKTLARACRQASMTTNNYSRRGLFTGLLFTPNAHPALRLRLPLYQFWALLGPSRLVLRRRLVGLRRALALLKGIWLDLGVGSARVE